MSKPFSGFLEEPGGAILIPAAFFTELLPSLSDIAEIQVTLAFFRLLNEGGANRPVPERALVRDAPLRRALRVEGSPSEPDRRIANGLDLAVGRNVLLRVLVSDGEGDAVWYYLNTLENQAQVAAMGRGAVAPPPDLWSGDEAPSVRPERPTVFRLYEQNIGVLTPLIAQRLVDALEQYPPEWIADAIGEAVSYNRRSWRYIARILENWAVTGRGDRIEGASNETYRRTDSKNLDPDQYKHGRYLDRPGDR